MNTCTEAARSCRYGIQPPAYQKAKMIIDDRREKLLATELRSDATEG
ncbi:hypothetical protein [Tatumella saanichensis]|nr:hypothetical protein [Tatumella saanichensis]